MDILLLPGHIVLLRSTPPKEELPGAGPYIAAAPACGSLRGLAGRPPLVRLPRALEITLAALAVLVGAAVVLATLFPPQLNVLALLAGAACAACGVRFIKRSDGPYRASLWLLGSLAMYCLLCVGYYTITAARAQTDTARTHASAAATEDAGVALALVEEHRAQVRSNWLHAGGYAALGAFTAIVALILRKPRKSRKADTEAPPDTEEEPETPAESDSLTEPPGEV